MSSSLPAVLEGPVGRSTEPNAKEDHTAFLVLKLGSSCKS